MGIAALVSLASARYDWCALLERVMTPALTDLEPKQVWKHFDALAAIPRASTKEAAAREYVLSIAAKHASEISG